MPAQRRGGLRPLVPACALVGALLPMGHRAPSLTHPCAAEGRPPGGAVVRADRQGATREGRRRAALERFLELPGGRRARRASAPAAQPCGRPLGAHRAHRTLALENAAAAGDAAWIEALLRAGVDVDATNVFGQTALFVAAWRGHAGTVAALAQSGADPAKPSNGGLAPWHAAASAGHIHVQRVLEAEGASLGGGPRASGRGGPGAARRGGAGRSPRSALAKSSRPAAGCRPPARG